MAFRIPRGYDTFRPAYLELCEGVRPNVSAVPLTAWTGLAPTRIDQVNHDPIVLEPGTIVGIATGGDIYGASTRSFSGKVFPACWSTGLVVQTGQANHPRVFFNYHHSDGATWGLPTSTNSGVIGVVKPIGVVFQPVYSFNLQSYFTNYKKQDNIGIVTDYVIQIPCTTAKEHLINAGDRVMVAHEAYEHGVFSNIGASSGFTNSRLAGRYERYDATLAGADEHVVGRCLKKVVFALDTGATAGDLLQDRLGTSPSTISLTTEATNEWADLDKVQTVPGLILSGSGTKGIPGHLLGARADANKYFAYLTLLIRL